MAEKFKVVCVNHKNLPKEIPVNCRLEEHEMYTVISVQKMNRQPGQFGFVLAEIQLPFTCIYDSFLSDRFRPASDDDMMAIEAVEDLLQGLEVGELMYLD